VLDVFDLRHADFLDDRRALRSFSIR